MLGQMSSGFDPAAVDEYWKAYTSEQRRRGMLELFRSGDLEKLEPYAGRLGQLSVPTLVLWGENDDEYAPVERAHRFGRELPDSRTVVVEGAGHFVWEDDPERCSREVVAFLDQSG
jgi:haloalkane dehalogenase